MKYQMTKRMLEMPKVEGRSRKDVGCEDSSDGSTGDCNGVSTLMVCGNAQEVSELQVVSNQIKSNQVQVDCVVGTRKK